VHSLSETSMVVVICLRMACQSARDHDHRWKGMKMSGPCTSQTRGNMRYRSPDPHLSDLLTLAFLIVSNGSLSAETGGALG
jgi:hypothetical protein